MGAGQQADARELQEAYGQPTHHVGNVCDASQDEKDSSDAGGGENQEEHVTGVALGGHSETPE